MVNLWSCLIHSITYNVPQFKTLSAFLCREPTAIVFVVLMVFLHVCFNFTFVIKNLDNTKIFILSLARSPLQR